MKATLVFRDQINVISSWFDSWNCCEQTVALYTTFRKLKPSQIKFLVQVLQQSASECTTIHTLEGQANNPVFVSELCKQSKDYAVQQLLECLPLLKIGNHAAKAEYLRIIPKILSHSVQNSCHIEESRQLLSYCLIHPAITTEERSRFTQWLVYLEERNTEPAPQIPSTRLPAGQDSHLNSVQDPNVLNGMPDLMNAESSVWAASTNRDSGIGLETSNYQYAHSTSGHIPPVGRAITSRPSSCVGSHAEQRLEHTHSSQADCHRKLTRSAPITPPTSNVSDWLNKHHEEMSKLSGSSQHSSGEPHAPLSPQSSCTSSGSECHDEPIHNQRNTFLEEGSGMRDVPVWLKGLRLHKYSYIFQQLAYEEMLGLNEEWLQNQNVTKGARHKIVLSISKLNDRQHQLRQLEKDVMDCCNLRQALTEVKSMLNTPIKMTTPSITVDENQSPLSQSGNAELDALSEGDIPGQITRLLGKMCTQLLVTTRPEEDCFGMYLQLLDKCIMHEAWSVEQKKKLASWKQQIQKTWHPSKYIEKQRKMYSNAMAQNNLQRLQRALRGQQLAQPANASKWAAFGGLPPNATTAANFAVPALNMPLYRNNSFNAAMNSRSPLYELQAKQPISKTNSVPLTKSNVYGIGPQKMPGIDVNMMEPELAARLDSLCLSMTEHAIGHFDSPEKGSTL